MLSHGVELPCFCGLWGLVACLSLFGLWACSVIIRRRHTGALLAVLVVSMLLGAVPFVALLGDGAFRDPDLLSWIGGLPLVSNALGVMLWLLVPQPDRDVDSE